jgi:hypothetical protein
MWSRRTFLRTLAGGLAASGIGGLVAATPVSKPYRIAPIPGRTYNPAFLRRCQRMRFATVEAAALGVRDECVEFLIIRDS